MTVREAVDTVTSLLVQPEIMEQGAEPVGGQVAEIGPQARRTGQDQPLVAVGTALAFGYLLGPLRRQCGWKPAKSLSRSCVRSFASRSTGPVLRSPESAGSSGGAWTPGALMTIAAIGARVAVATTVGRGARPGEGHLPRRRR